MSAVIQWNLDHDRVTGHVHTADDRMFVRVETRRETICFVSTDPETLRQFAADLAVHVEQVIALKDQAASTALPFDAEPVTA